MGFFSSNKTSTSTNTTTNNMPDWLKSYLQSNASNAYNLANQDATDLVAGFSGDQTTAQGAIRNLLGQGDSNYASAISSVLGNNFNGQSYQDYMNPFVKEVVNNQNNELVRTADINRNKIRDNAAMTNAFGSGRAMLAEQEANRDLNKQVSENTASGMANAYNSAVQTALAANQATNTQANTLANLTNAQTSNTLTQANALNQSGAEQQQYQQNLINAPMTSTSWLSSILNPMTSMYGSTTTGSTTTPTAGWGSQLLGAGLTAASLYGTGGLSSLFGAGSSTAGGFLGNSAYGNGAYNPTINWGSSSAFADGGLVQNKAEGGEISASPNSFIDLYRKIKGNFVSPLLSGIEHAASTIGKPSMVIDPSTGKLVPNTQQEPTKAETQSAAYSNVDQTDIKNMEAEIAKQLAEKQAAAPKTSNMSDFEKSVMEGGLLPPPVESQNPEQPSSAVTDVTQNIVNPVIKETSGQGPLTSLISDMVKGAPTQQGTQDTSKSSWMDNINLPLLSAGAAMMSSEKPFFGAVGEGLGAGATQLQREKASQQEAKQRSQEAAQKLMDSMINAQYKDAQLKLGQQRANISNRAVAVQEGQLKNRIDQTEATKKKALDFATKRAESELKTLMLSPESMKMSQEQLNNLRSGLQNKYYNDYMNGAFDSAGVAESTPTGVQSGDTKGVLDYNALAQKFKK